jgi:[ribosomal protein S5]-alanine N-acetyltransferase
MMLRTSRLKLEPIQPHHADAFIAGLGNERLYEFIDDHPPESVETLRKRFAHLATQCSPDSTQVWLNWAVWACDEARYVGYVQATILENRSAQIAYVLFRDAWGRGYAREAVAAMLLHLGEHWKVHTFQATVDPRNNRSIAVLLALGFSHIRCQVGAGRIRGILVDEFDYILISDAGGRVVDYLTTT